MSKCCLKTLWVCVIAAAVAAGGCSPAPVPDVEDSRAVETAVRGYNAALVRAYSEFDMNELSTAATQAQADRDFALMAALGEGRMQMLATLRSIEFGEATFAEEGRASILTTEVWDYDHVSLDTSETVRMERDVLYRLKYDLILQDGRWLVDSVTSVDDSPQPSE